jgi:ribosomal protein S18 acetylase RimI-like enzyme
MTGTPPPTVGTRQFAPPDALQTSALHLRALPDDFVTRFGQRFLARYHLAFSESPYATVIVASDYTTGQTVGALLGTLDTPAHYGWLVRHHGAELAALAVARAIRNPKLGWDLARTRAARYIRGIVRSSIFGRRSGKGNKGREDRVGLLAHVMVADDQRGRGIGSSLVRAYEIRAGYAGLERLELATLPDSRGAGPFYEKIGWENGGERVSQSGERFIVYRRTLPTDLTCRT